MTSLPGVGSWIERRARVAPDHVALVHGATRRSYAELAERIGRLSDTLLELGVAPGERVGWLGDNHPAYLETLFAVAKLGAIFAPVNHRLPAVAIAGVLDDYAVKIVIVNDAAATIEVPAGMHAIHVRRGASAGGYEDLIGSARGDRPRLDTRVDPDDVCIMPHTSGTTGSPKGVMLTHANVTWNVVNMLSIADFRSDDVTLALAPLFRTGGMGVNVLPLLFKGGTVVLPVATTPDLVLDAIERHRVTIGFGNPDLLDALTFSPRWASADLSSVRFVITGGAPVPERLIRTYGERGVTFLQGYGLSEASPVVSVLDDASVSRKSGSAGRPPLFVDVRTSRPDGSESAPLETGELLVRGPNLMAGYWNRPVATHQAIDELGWLHTGDAARIDEEGFLWIVDRVAHAFTSDGQVVYPGDVERCIGEHPAVHDVAVAGIDGSGHAFVVLRDGRDASATDIREHCRTRLEPRAVPTSVVFVDALPRTSVGKLDYSVLDERARSVESAH
jgi:fatty-acyl-CoA synthase